MWFLTDGIVGICSNDCPVLGPFRAYECRMNYHVTLSGHPVEGFESDRTLLPETLITFMSGELQEDPVGFTRYQSYKWDVVRLDGYSDTKTQPLV